MYRGNKLQFALSRTAAVRTFIHNVPRRRGTLKSHFNEKGKSSITALPLPDDGAVPAGAGRHGRPLISERFVMRGLAVIRAVCRRRRRRRPDST